MIQGGGERNQARSGDLPRSPSRPPPPGAFPEPPHPTLPVQPTVQPTFLSDYASVPYQPGTYVDSQVYHSRPSAHVHRAPDQTPPYGRNGPPGRLEPSPPPPSVPNQSLITRGLPGRPSSRESYFVHPRSLPQIPTVGPTSTSEPHQTYGYPAPQPHASASQPYPSRVGRNKVFLVAMDYDDRRDPPEGIIVDDAINVIMVKPLPEGCRLTAVLDCCNSGALLDLPYVYDSNGMLKQNRPDIVRQKASEAVVISLSACGDGDRAYEIPGGGALRQAFIDLTKRSRNSGTCPQVIQGLRAYMVQRGLDQRPQLSSSHWIDTDQRFTVAG